LEEVRPTKEYPQRHCPARTRLGIVRRSGMRKTSGGIQRAIEPERFQRGVHWMLKGSEKNIAWPSQLPSPKKATLLSEMMGWVVEVERNAYCPPPYPRIVHVGSSHTLWQSSITKRECVDTNKTALVRHSP